MQSAFNTQTRKDEPSFWTVLIATALFIGFIVIPPAGAEEADAGFTQAAFIRTQSIDVTVMSFDTSRFLQGIPLTLTSSERAFRQIRPGVDYKRGMVWLTFKYNGHGGVISQIRNFKIKRSYPPTLRLTDGRARKAAPRQYLPHRVVLRAEARRMPQAAATRSLFVTGPREIEFWNPAT